MNNVQKKNYAKWSWNEEEMDGQSRPSNVTLHRIIQIQHVLGRKYSQLFATIPKPCYSLGTLYDELTSLPCSSILLHGQLVNFWNWSF
jgi:hypothetical protein